MLTSSLLSRLVRCVLTWSWSRVYAGGFCCLTSVSPSHYGFNIEHVECRRVRCIRGHERRREVNYLELAPSLKHFVGGAAFSPYSKIQIEMLPSGSGKFVTANGIPSSISCWQRLGKRGKGTRTEASDCLPPHFGSWQSAHLSLTDCGHRCHSTGILP